MDTKLKLGDYMLNYKIPSLLNQKRLPSHKSNILSTIKEKYGWETYGDITIEELKKLYKQHIAHFWTVIKYLSFQGVGFSGKLQRYQFFNENGKGYTLVFDKKNKSTILDFEYKYAFLKIQLEPYGIAEKYDLHLVPLHHVINEHMKIEEVITFFQSEGFDVLPEETLNQSGNNLSTLLNSTEKEKSIENELVFSVKEKTYILSSVKRDMSLKDESIPASKILRVLNNYGYEKVGDLPTDMSFLLDIPNVAQRSVEKFFFTIDNNLTFKKETPTKKKVQNLSRISTENSFLFIEEQIPLEEEFMTIPLERKYWGNKMFELLQVHDMKYLGDLPYDLESFLKDNGYKKVERRELSAKIFEHLPTDYLKELFFQSLKLFVDKRKPDSFPDRDWSILLQRLDGCTLEEIGQHFDVTRERIRQIISKGLEKMFVRYNKLFSIIESELKQYPFLNVYDFFNNREEALIEKASSFIYVYALPFNIYGNYLTLDDRDLFYDKIKAFKSDIAKDRNETHIYSREEIEEYVLEYFPAKEICDFRRLTDELISESFEEASENQYTFKQRISKTRMCQIVFEKEFANGLAVYKQKDLFIKKLHEYFPQEFKNDTARSIIANLTRDEHVILLWEIGYFKHISVVHPNVSKETLAPIKDWLQSQLSQDIKQINTNAAFGEFGDILSSLEIDTEHALFSLLKIHFPEAFNYSRSPTLVMIGHERKEKKKIIEDYVKDCDGYVSNEELSRHFMKNLGWTKTMYEQYISASELLLKTSDGLIHMNCLDFEKDDMDRIFRYAKQKTLSLQNSYSVETIFEERKSTLLQMGVKDGKVLYHLLEKYYSEEFDFTRYPHIHPVGKYKTDQFSVAGQFETFFLENNDYFLRDEIYKEFVQERGWAMSTYYMAYSKNREKILEVFPDEFAHIELIEWTKEKENQLFQVLEGFLTENKDKPFIHIERDIIANKNLVKQFPDINLLFDWNHSLLVSILENTDAFVLLGSKKVGILSKANEFGIKSEHEYLSYLLKNKYDGYVKLAELQKYLFSIDMCRKSSIPRYYLTSSEKELDYELVNDELILKELMVRG
ncbi:sigma-70-like protein [Bacillus oleivorans]|uniref:Sigma-70-like protein n=1 Tax=Bacillus oleivorans TaxID=1448271 RepID=A0A285D6W4_9BACI|nr:sigma factor-like helix-turn-helix DNA-binding protein [Bacillus oleivorans]SNX75542.1 sigma-70-like protein [Bacillus oleivorans]